MSAKRSPRPQPDESLRLRRFKILADECRLGVLEALLEGPVAFATLQGSCGVEQSLLSHHLRVLRDEGLVECDRDGKNTIYRLSEGIRAARGAIELGCCRIFLR